MEQFTNKAPEKIYLATTEEVQNFDHSFVGIAHSDPRDIVEPIEYIRKDAFIGKACEFIKDNGSHFIDIVNGQLVLKKGIIKDFKKYLEL